MAAMGRHGMRTAIAAALAWSLPWAGPLACGDAAPDPAAQQTQQEVPDPAAQEAQQEAEAPDAPEAPAVAPPAGGEPEAEGPTTGAGDVPADLSDVADGLQPQMDPPEADSYWLLTEFDWGDEREVVYESTRFDPFYTCHNKNRGICALTQVDVEGEDLLAEFHFNSDDRLFQMLFLTPNLNREQADAHLERVWQGLIDYVTRHKGEPEVTGELPDLDSLEVGPPTQTHLWRADGLEMRAVVGRRDAEAFYTGMYFTDPSQPDASRIYRSKLEQADRAFRARQAGRAADAPSESPGSGSP